MIAVQKLAARACRRHKRGLVERTPGGDYSARSAIIGSIRARPRIERAEVESRTPHDTAEPPDAGEDHRFAERPFSRVETSSETCFARLEPFFRQTFTVGGFFRGAFCLTGYARR